MLSFRRQVTAQTTSTQLSVRCWLGMRRLISFLLVILSCWALVGQSPVLAGLHDDRFDGDIFALYAGNGSIVPPKVTLAEAFQRKRPILLVFYVDDSQDCKEYSLVVSQLQNFYGRVAEFMPIRVDSLTQKPTKDLTDPAYYYKGFVPQTVLFDANGKVVLNEMGQISLERVDDVFREVFDLLPRTESVELKRRQVNELTTELVK